MCSDILISQFAHRAQIKSQGGYGKERLIARSREVSVDGAEIDLVAYGAVEVDDRVERLEIGTGEYKSVRARAA